jgi:hypothetical protein
MVKDFVALNIQQTDSEYYKWTLNTAIGHRIIYNDRYQKYNCQNSGIQHTYSAVNTTILNKTKIIQKLQMNIAIYQITMSDRKLWKLLGRIPNVTTSGLRRNTCDSA